MRFTKGGVFMDVLLSLEEACRVMRVSCETGRRMARSGSMPFRKLGKNWVIPRSALYRELGLEAPKETERKSA